MIHIDYARKKLAYNPETGSLEWLRGSHKGRAAGHWHNGQYKVRMASERYRAADLAWLLATGTWPEHPAQTMDGEATNLALSNLSCAPVVKAPKQPTSRKGKPRNANPYGAPGIRLIKDRYYVRVQFMGKPKHIGVFWALEDAHAAIKEWHEKRQYDAIAELQRVRTAYFEGR